MPIYEFRCVRCGNRFEKLCQQGDSGENIKCPDCSTTSTRRIMSSFCNPGGANNGNGLGCASCNSANCSDCG
ncbi:MAG: zinc ribbon domain-containing protein [Desulfotomaculaceae bacterium]|nr:zinc ribbon domain-containing protein [Desulfotomaculaceae bacterium]